MSYIYGKTMKPLGMIIADMTEGNTKQSAYNNLVVIQFGITSASGNKLFPSIYYSVR